MRRTPCPRWTSRQWAIASLCAVVVLVPMRPIARAQQRLASTQQEQRDSRVPATPARLPALDDAEVDSRRPPSRSPAMAISPAMTSPVSSELSPQFHVPVQQPPTREKIVLEINNGLVTLVVHDAQLQDVLSALADSQNVNIVCATNASTAVSITLHDVPLDEALTAIVSICGCTWTKLGKIIHVTDLAAKAALAPEVQGKQIQVFSLDFVAGDDLLQAIKTMLSPMGNAYVTAVQESDNRRTQESLVVEDLPNYLTRVAQYVHQMDRAPKQVLIEVHVLQIQLENGCRHGVNFTHMMNIAGNTVRLQMTGYANPNAPQAFFAQLTASNLFGLLEAVKDSTDAKTLASPKVMALNGQMSRIQIGEKLGYRVLSNTQTSTLESVEFLDVGVVLEVTPTISNDGRILMEVHPKVSSGQVVEDTGLPNEKTSEVNTSVLLQDGQGMVIGGLIQEEDIDTESRLMFLGDLYLVGGLFQRRVASKVRKEVVFFLVPRIVPGSDACDCDPCEALEHARLQTRLFHGPLHRNDRPYDARFPTCYDRPQQPWMQKIHDRIFSPEGDCGIDCSPHQGLELIQPGTSAVQPDGVPHVAPIMEGSSPPAPETILLDPLTRRRPVRSQRPEMARLPAVDQQVPASQWR